MNKFFTKIIGASLAIAMMVGGAVGINAAETAKPVHADPGDSFQRITSASDISAGDVVIIVNQDKNKAMSTTQNNNNRGYVAVTSTNDVITIPNNSTIQELTVYAGSTNGQFGFYTGTGFLYAVNNNNYLRTQSDNNPAASDVTGTSAWTIAATNTGVFTIANVSAQKSSTNIYIAWNNSNSIFSGYGSGQQKPYVYKKVVTSTAEVDTVTASIKPGDYYVGSTLSAPDFDVTVTWTEGKDDTNPTSGFTWTVNGIANGTLNEGNNAVVVTYQGVSSQPFNVTAIIEPGTTQDNPLSVGDAVTKGSTLTAGNETAKLYYIQGVVSEVVTNTLADDNGYATFWLQNGNTAHGFEAYQITAADGCSNYNDLRAGAEVLLKCKILKYNSSTIETGSGKSLLSISYTAPTLSGIILNKTTMNLKVGEYETLTASPDPIGAELGDVSWESSDENVATVNASGKVTGIDEGTVTITATSGGFNATCSVTVVLAAALDLSTDTTTSASTSLLTWNVENRFALKAEKASASTNTNNYYPGTENQNYTSTRFYKNSKLTLTPDPANITAVKAEFLATTDGYANKLAASAFVNATATVSATNSKLVVVTFTNGLKPFVATISDTCGFSSIELIYTRASAKQKVEYGLATQTQLSYRYTGNAQDGFAYSDISIRFGANITKALWDELDTNEHVISGFGVIIADGDLVTNATDMAAAMSDIVSSTVTTTFTQEVYAIDYFVPIANKASTIGEDANNYFWNLRWAIDEANMDKMYSAVAYIKVGDEYVLMNMARESVETLALDYLTSRGCNETTAEGSLQAIVDNAA